MNQILTQEKLEAYLGRSLTAVELNNLDLYLNLAKLRLEDLLCITLTLPLAADLGLLLARCFGVISQEQERASNSGVSSKKVEDFSLTYDTDAKAPMFEFVRLNSDLIDKYSACQGSIRSGKVRHGECLRCV